MIVSSDDEFLRRAKHLTTQAKADALRYTHDEIGYNYRLTNLQAALGLAQLEKLETFIETKAANYEYYRSLLGATESDPILPFRDGTRSNHWFYAYVCKGGAQVRDALIEHLQSVGIQTRPIWGLIHEQIPYEGALVFDVSRALYYHDQVVNIPCSTNLQVADVERVSKEITEWSRR